MIQIDSESGDPREAKLLERVATERTGWPPTDSCSSNLRAGDSLGPYEIVAPIGAGGMGKVYRALDTNLGRHVAVKVLRDNLGGIRGRITRTNHEAQVLAGLNHPNIASIYGQEGRALIMELVEGPTLGERIREGPVPLQKALPIARQIVDALEYAHEKGVVHRDLKPANIKFTTSGAVKILDFGLATVIAIPGAEGDPADSPTLTMGYSDGGVILGTVAYMAPEQARGKRVDKRADIWAFGVVLYEMLTGTRLFGGETVSDMVAAVLTRDPTLELVPPEVHNLLRRCLEKDPTRRLRDIGDAWFLIEQSVLSLAKRPRLWMHWHLFQ